MKGVKHTCDVELIKGVLKRENIYDNLVYDGSPSLNDYVPRGIWLLLLEHEAIAGMINLEPLNNVMWQCHVFIFEKYRHNNSEAWGKLAASYMADNAGAKKFIGLTPYMEARKWAEKVGFKCVARLDSSIKKDGKLLDQWVLELGV